MLNRNIYLHILAENVCACIQYQFQPPLHTTIASLSTRPQEAGSGRSQLAAAFNRWRLHAFSAALEDSATLTSSRTGDTGTFLTMFTDTGDFTAQENPRTQTLTEMWEAAGGASGDQHRIHRLILAKEKQDRPLPSELCDAYAREMVDRINHRQTNNNVPIPMPFF